MRNRHCIIIVIMFSTALASLTSEEFNLTRYYLTNALESYQAGKMNLVEEQLALAGEFSTTFPEYYYLKIKLLPLSRDTAYQANVLAERMIDTIDSLFLMSGYDCYRTAADAGRRVMSYDKAIQWFEKMISFKSRVNQADYLDYLEMLYQSGNYKLMPSLLYKARQHTDSLELAWFELLYKARSGKYVRSGVIEQLRVLVSNGFSKTRTTLLQVLFAKDRGEASAVFNSYRILEESGEIEPLYRREIIYKLLMRSDLLDRKQILELLTLWEGYRGLFDYRTDILLQEPLVSKTLKHDKTLHAVYTIWSGVRLQDVDSNGDWEEYREFRSGIVVLHQVDSNQDGIIESEYRYRPDGAIMQATLDNGSGNSSLFIFNPEDESLQAVTRWENGEKIRTIYILSSTIFPDISELNNYGDSRLLTSVDRIEQFQGGKGEVKYFKGDVQYRLIDDNQNGIVERKEFYSNGVVSEVLRDVDEDGYYEMKEEYLNGKLIRAFYKTVSGLTGYDYYEDFTGSEPVLYWDYDFDGIYETSVIRKKNGMVWKRVDINFDGKYDYVFELENNNVIRMLNVAKNVWMRMRMHSVTDELEGNGWMIVSALKIDDLKIPQSIVFDHGTIQTGIYYYDNKKQFFEKGIVKNKYFHFKIERIRGKIYLFDLTR